MMTVIMMSMMIMRLMIMKKSTVMTKAFTISSGNRSKWSRIQGVFE